MPVRVFVANGDVQVEIEGEETYVEKKLTKLLPFVMGNENGGAAPATKKQLKEKEEEGRRGPAPHTLQSYVKAKDPNNVYEAIALVLDFARKYENKAEMSSGEIRAGLLLGKYHPPKSMAQALADCRRRYGFVVVGAKKGYWKLSNQGETLVELDLPRAKKPE